MLGDLNNPDSLVAAAAGMDGVFHIGPAFDPCESAMGVAMMQAARGAGVRKFVYSGVIHPEITDMVNHAAKLPAQEALSLSGLDYIVLQPAVFMQGLGERNWDEMVTAGLPTRSSATTKTWTTARTGVS